MNEIMNTSKEQLAVNRLDALAAEIRGFTASLLSSVIEIGRRFHEAKELLPYGEFGDWAREETGYSVSTVNNYMRLFEEYGDRQGSLFGASLDSQTFGKLTYSKALALLAIEDKTEREAFVEDHDVDSMSTRELRQAIKERDEAIKRAEEAEKHLESVKQDRENMLDELDATKGERDDLEHRLQALENTPKEVAVEKVVDQEAIDAAVAKAKEEAQKKIEAAEKARETAERKLQRAEEKAKAAETKAADAGKGAGEELTRAKAEAKAAREEAENLRKQLRMSDAAVTAFKVMFQQWQGDYQKMVDTFDTMDEETREKLRAAIRAQIEAWGWGKEDA